MTGTTTALCPCGQPAPDATICRTCTDRLATDLASVPWLREQLDLALSRQTATGGSDGGRKSAEIPLPFHVGASDALEYLGSILATMVRAVAPAVDPDARPRRIDDMAAYLTLEIRHLRQWPGVYEQARKLYDSLHKGNRTVDLAPDEFFCGPCDGHGYAELPPEDGCPGWVYAQADEDGKPERHGECRECKTSYQFEMRRDWMLDAADGYLAPAAALSRFLTWKGEPLNASTLRTWVDRGRIQQKGTDLDGRPMYLVKDVRDLLAELTAKRLSRSSNGH